MGITALFYGVVAAIKSTAEAVIELDSAFLEMSKVTDLSTEQLEKFGEKADEVGKKVYATTSDVIQAAADFARMGFDEDEALGLSEMSIVLTKVADGIDDVGVASTALIAILKGFQMEATETEHIIDAINEVSNNFAVSTDDMTDGLRRVGATMGQAGVTMEETIGLLVGTNEGMQNIEKSSAGLITISTRLRRVKEDVEVAEGLVLNLEDAFKQYAGIDLTKPNGELKNTYDVLTELASVWGDLEPLEREYIAFLTSGTRQSPVLNNLMVNLKNTLEATATATNSAGSAMEEFEKVQDSLSGKLDQLEATWTRIKTDFMDSQFLGSLIDLGNAFGLLIETIGGISTVVNPINAARDAIGELMGYDMEAKFSRDRKAFQGIIDGAFTLGEAFQGLEYESKMERLVELQKRLKNESLTPDEYNRTTKEIKGLQSEIDRLQGSYDKYVAVMGKSNTTQEEQAKMYQEVARAKMEQLNSNEELIDSTEELAMTVSSLDEVFYQYIQNGKLTEEMAEGIIGNHELINKIMGLTEEELYSLGRAWGLSSDQIAEINTTLTNLSIDESQKRISAIKYEQMILLQTLQKYRDIANIDISGDPVLGKNPLLRQAQNEIASQANAQASIIEAQLNGIESSLSELDALRDRADWDFAFGDDKKSGGTEKAAKELEAYFSTLQEIAQLQNQQAQLEKQSELDGIDRSEQIISNLEEQANKMRILNDFREKDLASLREKLKVNSDDVELLEAEASLVGDIAKTEEKMIDVKLAINAIEKERSDIIKARKLAEDEAWEDLENRREELIKKQADEIRKSLEQEKKLAEEKLKGLEEVEDKIIEMIKHRYETEKDELDDQLSEFKNYINEKKRLLGEEYDEEDYKNKVVEQSEVITEIQNEIDKNVMAARSGDMEAMARLTELNRKLESEKKTLSEMQRDRERQLREANLDEELQAMEEITQKKKEEIDERLTDERLYEEARQTIIRGTFEFAEGQFVSLEQAYIDFEDRFGEGMSILGDSIKDDFISKIDDAKDALNDLQKLLSKTNMNIDDAVADEMGKYQDSSNNPLGMSKTDFEIYKENKKDWESGKDVEKANIQNSILRDKYDISEDRYSYDDLKGYYDQGGIANGIGFMAKNTLKPERVLDPNMTKVFDRFIDFMPDFKGLMSTSMNPGMVTNNNSGVNLNNKFEFKVTGSMDRQAAKNITEEVSTTILRQLQQLGR